MARIWNKLYRVAEISSRIPSREIATDMQTKLPRELRDLIYSYLIKKPQTIIVDHQEPDATGLERDSIFFRQSPIPGIIEMERSGPALLPERVGQDTYQEALETIYGQATFILDYDWCLERFADTQIWNSNFHPMAFISKLKITISEANYDQPARRAELVDRLKVLDGLRTCKTRVSIKIDQHRWSISPRIAYDRFRVRLRPRAVHARVDTHEYETEAATHNRIFATLVELLLPLLRTLAKKGLVITISDGASHRRHLLCAKLNITVEGLLAERREHRLVSTSSTLQ
jgi:hypothetical protein